MFHLLQIAGGVALILFGVQFFRKGLDRIFGASFSEWMRRLASNRFRAFFAGLSIASVMPSSTTISLLAVQTVQAGHMSTPQMLAVMLGANIGLTVMVQLLAFRIETFAPIFILMGVGLFQFTRSSLHRGIGQALISLGFIFMAMQVISIAIAPMLSDANSGSDLIQILHIVEKYPFWLMALTAMMTLAMQSSTATIGLVIGVAAAGAPSLAIAVPAVIGANVGIALNTVIVGWRQADSRNMGVANLSLKFLVAALAFAFTDQIINFSDKFPMEPARKIAHLHTVFNVVLAIVGMPLVPYITKLVARFFPAPDHTGHEPFAPRYIHDAPLDSPAIALSQSTREILRTSEIVRSMLTDLWDAFATSNETKVQSVRHRDDQIDLLDTEIKRFLTRLGGQMDEIANSREQILQLSYLTELEMIGDIIDKNLSEIVMKQIRLRTHFTAEMLQELKDFHHKVCENLLIAETVFTTRDQILAHQLWRHRDFLSRQEFDLREMHFGRMNAGQSISDEASRAFLDLLNNLSRINNCASHLAYAVLQDAQGSDHARPARRSASSGD